MGLNSSIEWTTHTFNPWWGCTAVSEGCRFCYAESLSKRYGHDVWGQGKDRRLMGDSYWQAPLTWNTAAAGAEERPRVFCASMADVFDPGAPATERARLWELIALTPNLDWLILTKRPELMTDGLPADWGMGYENVWLGTSVEDNRVTQRISDLTAVPAHLHFLSLEPLIGPLKGLPLEGIEWAIVGGESGSKPRPMNLDWVRSIKKQCRDSNTAFFFKQMGTSLAREMRCSDRKGGKITEIPREFRVRQIPGRPDQVFGDDIPEYPPSTAVNLELFPKVLAI